MGLFGNRAHGQQVTDCTSGVHPHTCDKNTEKGNKANRYNRPRKGGGTVCTSRSVYTPDAFGWLCQIRGNGILHILLIGSQHCTVVFNLPPVLLCHTRPVCCDSHLVSSHRPGVTAPHSPGATRPVRQSCRPGVIIITTIKRSSNTPGRFMFLPFTVSCAQAAPVRGHLSRQVPPRGRSPPAPHGWGVCVGGYLFIYYKQSDGGPAAMRGNPRRARPPPLLVGAWRTARAPAP